MQSKNETSLKYITISFTHQMTRLWRFHWLCCPLYCFRPFNETTPLAML